MLWQIITLENCYALAIKNYPLAKQSELLAQKSAFETASLNTAKLPKIDLNAQASYQSEVTGLPIPLPNVTPLITFVTELTVLTRALFSYF